MTFEALESSEIKDSYFYRNSKWDWLNNDMIHVFDNERPRVITMDPWPQKVFLDALGQQTVEEYILSVANEYPKNQAPKELDQVILKQLEDLAYGENVITISSSPFALNASILNPMTEEGNIDLQGTWLGQYQYGIPDTYKDETMMNVNFTLTIDTVKNNKFSGTVEDDLATGGTPGTGIVKGTYREDIIRFTKNMPIKASFDTAGNHHLDQSKKHPTLFYTGEFSRSKQTITGTWKFKKKLFFWKGFIPIFFSPGQGTFNMTKRQNQ
ncbi:hypothetical protein [uncultured Psychroserpens sp.]|uniref:hypothetical protein n=1 Tax=uncultured Psychroserpens sp. TaxID=255436 RepID=UPI002611CECE|nr:hypothetical protein [uncultured Psychroserpens sp.]